MARQIVVQLSARVALEPGQGDMGLEFPPFRGEAGALQGPLNLALQPGQLGAVLDSYPERAGLVASAEPIDARQGEVAYKRTVADWQRGQLKKGAGAAPGRASGAARQGSAPEPAL